MEMRSNIVMEPHTGALIQDTFADARALARVLNRPILVRGNDTEVWVHRHTTEEECRQMYENALAGRSHRKRGDNGGWRWGGMDRQRAERIVDELLNDLQGRRGLKTEWGRIEEDVQNEVRDTWTRIVQRKSHSPARHPEDILAEALVIWKQSDTPIGEQAATLASALSHLLLHYK